MAHHAMRCFGRLGARFGLVFTLTGLTALAACAGAPDPQSRHGEADARGAGGGARGGEGGPSSGGVASVDLSSARQLAPGATFADLVRAAQRQDELRAQDSTEGCLLRRAPATGARGVRLEADLATAVRPLPDASSGLEDRTGSVAVLTRYDAFGSADAELQLAAITTSAATTSPDADVLVVTRGGLYYGGTQEGATWAWEEPSSIQRLDDGARMLFVTADADVPLDELVRVLEAVGPRAGRVALAVALPAGVVRPPSGAPELEQAPLCPAEPTEGGASEAPTGELSREALLRGVAPLVARAGSCAGLTSGPGARGGRVVVQLQIGEEGRVLDACVAEDATEDGILRACLLGTARELSFERPRGGPVAVAIPFSIAPNVAFTQRSLCD